MPWLMIAWVVLSVVSYLLRPKAAAPVTPEAGEVTGTTVDAASSVPVLFGTRKMNQPNCVWYGDIGTTPIIACSGGKK